MRTCICLLLCAMSTEQFFCLAIGALRRLDPVFIAKKDGYGQMSNLYSSHGRIAGHLNRFESRAAGGCVSPLGETPPCPAGTSSRMHGGLVSTTQDHICSQYKQQPTQFLICCPGRSVPYSAVTFSAQRHQDGKGCFTELRVKSRRMALLGESCKYDHQSEHYLLFQSCLHLLCFL